MAEPMPPGEPPTVDEPSAVVAPRPPSLPRTIGRYRVLSRLGAGGFGTVYRGRDDDLLRDVAIKVPRPDRVTSSDEAANYLAEARALARLVHPGIVPVYDVGRTEDGLPFVVSRYMEGGDLAAHHRRVGLTCSEVASLVAQVAEALHHAHEHGIVHRDIKPANILLDRTSVSLLLPVVADFGLALREEDFGTGATLAGTPAYMSPEQARGEGHRVDARTDVYSLGVVLYELLTGRVPFQGESTSALLRLVISQEPRPPRQLDPQIPRELDRICLKCLAKRVSDRYSTAADLAEDLRAWLATTPPSEEKPVSTVDPAAGLPVTPTARRIVPRGLRAFDAHDASFFLELLPGPRDAQNLPDSLSFWKSRLEERDADRTFRIGLLYGPSGCGKSSLVKAGLLPRLGSHLETVFVESTVGDTETRLQRALAKVCPTEAMGGTLTQALSGLRRRRGPAADRKVVIVLDQFEQWLHSWKGEADAELIRALRQCDGAHVQAILLVRDDFWMAVTRLFQALEVRLIEGHNSAAVDLFDPQHARKVLRWFGQAYGRLSDSPTEGEDHFLDQAITGLMTSEKVVPVHLSLFAEMVKARPWEPAVLQAVGGPAGLGVAFLEETFGGRTAPPLHRRHAQAARAVLERMLQEAGLILKGPACSRQELLSVAGYAERTRDFDELLDILDGELRLITPVDPESLGGAEGKGPFYQLTHDNLVPSLRLWLTRKRRETARGRAEIRLEERTTWWQARQESRQLPSWSEWVRIRLLTRRASWTEPQHAMMRAAGRHHALRGGFLGVFLVGLLCAGLFVRSLVQESRERAADALVNQLVSAKAEDIFLLFPEIVQQREHVEPRLRGRIADSAEDSLPALRARLGLLTFDPSQASFLREALFDIPLSELLIVRDALKPHTSAAEADDLWATVEKEPTRRLRAACVLASWNPNSPHWETQGAAISEGLIHQPRSTLDTWVQGFEPVRTYLHKPLARCIRDGKSETRLAAVHLVAGLAHDAPTLLAELLVESEPAYFPLLLTPLRSHKDHALARFKQELDLVPVAHWKNDPTVSWPSPNPEVVKRLEAGHGLVAERFAFTQTLLLTETLRVAEAIRPAGYRLVQLRPYEVQGRLQASALWTRDGKEGQFVHGLTAQELENQDAARRQTGVLPLDVTGYRDTAGEEKYAAVWGPLDASVSETRLMVGKTIHSVQMETPQAPRGYTTRTRSFCASPNGLRVSAVWEKRSGIPLPTAPTLLPDLGFKSYERDLQNVGSPWTDIRLDRAFPLDPRQIFTRFLKEVEQEKQKTPDGQQIRQNTMAWALFGLGQEEKALPLLTAILKKAPKTAPGRAYEDCAILHARLGQAREARQVLADCARNLPNHGMLPWARAVVEACLDEGDNGEAAIRAYMTEFPEQVYYAACAYGCAYRTVARKAPDRGARYAERTLELLERSLPMSWINDWFINPYIIDLHSHPGFQALARTHSQGLWCSGIAYHGIPFASTESHGLDPATHLSRCREFAAAGARPVALSVVATGTDNRVLTASVWHQPAVTDLLREAHAHRQANAAAALLALGQADGAWPLLRLSPEPRLRTALLHRLAACGISPELLRSRLSGETDPGVRQALLLGLGDYSDAQWANYDREGTAAEVLRIARDDPNAGVHSAAEWLLRRWGHEERLRHLESSLVSREPQAARQWFVNSQGHTLAVFPGPHEFAMGSPPGEAGRLNEERLHSRRIPRTFALATKETTREQYQRFRPLRLFPARRDNTPAEPATPVTWLEAAQYCRWLSEREGIPEAEMCYPRIEQIQVGMQVPEDFLSRTGYRLPTEAEWEFACRAGTTTPRFYGWGEPLLNEYAWNTHNARGRPWPVGQLRPNPFGLFDILGNAHEWCHDLGGNYPRPGRQPTEDRLQTGDVIQATDQRVYRGRGYNTEGPNFRSAARNKGLLTDSGSIGFRVARTLR